MSPDVPVPYYPAYLPAARQVPAVPYQLTPLAEAVLAEPEAKPEAGPGYADPTYITEIWCPPVDDGIQRLHSPMKEPEPARPSYDRTGNIRRRDR